MQRHHHNHFFNAQTYIGLFAEDFIDYIDKTAGTNVNNLFVGEENRFQINKDNVLFMVLGDRSLLEDLHRKIIHWKLVVSENSIKLTRLAFRTHYFAPIAAHPKWEAFLAKHPNTPQSIIDQIRTAFFYWILQHWLDKQTDPVVKKSTQPLIKIINSNSSDAALCKEFENSLIVTLKNELSGFFLPFADFDGKKEDITEQVKNKLIALQESHQSQFENIKMIVWKRIEDFLENNMSVDVDGTKNHIKPDIKNEIAKGLLEYFNSQTTETERASHKYHITLTNICNNLFLQVSKDKHKKYESLFIYVPKDVKNKQKRNDYGQQRLRPVAQSVSHIKHDARHIEVDINQLNNVRRSLKAFSSSPATKNDFVETIDAVELKEVRFDAKEHAKLTVISPRRVSTHYRRESFFAPPKTAVDALGPEPKEIGEKSDPLLTQIAKHK